MDSAAECSADKKTIQDVIKSLREIDKKFQPNAYKAGCSLVIDIWKYKIDNAPKKIGLRRMLERKLNKNKIDEIPNLIELME